MVHFVFPAFTNALSLFSVVRIGPTASSRDSTAILWDRQYMQAIRAEWRVIVWRA